MRQPIRRFVERAEYELMVGRNQHHIPQFFQRGFGVRQSGRPKEIWKYQKGVEPELAKIKRTAAGDWFYSQRSDDGTKTLDDQITDRENAISRTVDALRNTPVGSVVDATLAVEILTHLAPRTSHLRSLFGWGVAGLIEGVREIFTDKANLKALLGLKADQPTARFQKHLASYIGADSPFAQLDLPPAVLEQVIFQLTKESLDRLAEEQIPQLNAVLGDMTLTAPQMARDGHNKALTGIMTDASERDDLLACRWTIEAAPLEGAILPDCVAIAFVKDGMPHAFIGSSREDVRAVVLALSTDKLLVGVREGEPVPRPDTINVSAAACCHEFFLAATDAYASLIDEIGKVATADIETGLNGAFQEFWLDRASTTVVEQGNTGPVPEDQDVQERSVSGSLSYQVTCLDFGDEELVGRLATALNYIIEDIAKILPLDRLDGITFATDYSAGLRSIDWGRPNLPPPKTVTEDVGVGVAMTLPVERDGTIKGRIVMTSRVALGLIGEADSDGQWALHMIVHELAQVLMIQLFDESFPGIIFEPPTDGYEGSLFLSVNNALDSYAASRVSSCFGDYDEIMHAHQQLLVSILALSEQKIPEARLAYRYDGDISKLLEVARPIVGHILSFSASLLGHADGNFRTPFDDEGVLVAALAKAGLLDWLKIFEGDLRTYWDRRGRWESLDELFRFNRHVERVYWQFGMFWSRNEGGGSRLDIPLATDASALLEAGVRGVPVPNLPPA